MVRAARIQNAKPNTLVSTELAINDRALRFKRSSSSGAGTPMVPADFGGAEKTVIGRGIRSFV